MKISQSGPVTALPPSSKRWAIIIGVDKYLDKQINSLSGASNDARALTDALVNYAGFPRDQIILLASDQPDERQPTRPIILKYLSNLRYVVPSDGLLLIAFAGHGIESNGQAYLLPSDVLANYDKALLEDTAINLGRLKENVRSSGVKQVLIILDACRNDPSSGRAYSDNPLTKAFKNALDFDVRNKEVEAFAVLYATSVGHRAYEYSEKKQGYFMWGLVQALKGEAANNSGEVTLGSLVKYLEDTVPRYVNRDLGREKQQRPFAVIEGYKANDLVLSVAKSAKSTSSYPGSSENTDVKKDSGSTSVDNKLERSDLKQASNPPLSGLQRTTKPWPQPPPVQHGPITLSPSNMAYVLNNIGGRNTLVKFRAFLVNTNDNSQLNIEVANPNNDQGSHVWDEKWYYWRLPHDGKLLLAWRNLTENTQGWLFVQKYSNVWWYKTNSAQWKVIDRGNEASEFWVSDGKRITISIKIPIQRDGWTDDDVEYKFGY